MDPRYLQSPQKPQDVRFFTSTREKESLANLSTLYATLVQIENLEKVFLKGSLAEPTYEEFCQKLIARGKTAFIPVASEGYSSMEAFCERYNVHLPLAIKRVKEGKPITQMVRSGSNSKAVAEIITLFITLLDKIRLEVYSVDELFPDLHCLNELLYKFPSTNNEFKEKVKEWHDRMEKMAAADEIDASSARQFHFDLSNSMDRFNALLEQH